MHSPIWYLYPHSLGLPDFAESSCVYILAIYCILMMCTPGAPLTACRWPTCDITVYHGKSLPRLHARLAPRAGVPAIAMVPAWCVRARSHKSATVTRAVALPILRSETECAECGGVSRRRVAHSRDRSPRAPPNEPSEHAVVTPRFVRDAPLLYKRYQQQFTCTLHPISSRSGCVPTASCRPCVLAA